MNIGTVFILLVWIAFIVFGIVGGFADIWPFGILIAVLTTVIVVYNIRKK